MRYLAYHPTLLLSFIYERVCDKLALHYQTIAPIVTPHWESGQSKKGSIKRKNIALLLFSALMTTTAGSHMTKRV